MVVTWDVYHNSPASTGYEWSRRTPDAEIIVTANIMNKLLGIENVSYSLQLTPIPRGRVLPGKLNVALTVKKFFAIYGTRHRSLTDLIHLRAIRLLISYLYFF